MQTFAELKYPELHEAKHETPYKTGLEFGQQ